MTRDEYREYLLVELREYEADMEALSSPAWGRIRNIFKLRRETLMSLVMNDKETDPVETQRLKGRFQEVEYFMTLMEFMKEDAVTTLEKLQEIDIAERDEKMVEEQGALL